MTHPSLNASRKTVLRISWKKKFVQNCQRSSYVGQNLGWLSIRCWTADPTYLRFRHAVTRYLMSLMTA